MADTDSVTPEPCQLSIRLPRPLWFGLAGVLLILAAVGMGIGIPAYRQHRAVQRIKQLGGGVATEPRGPEWIRELIGEERLSIFEDVEYVTFWPDEATYRKRDWRRSVSGPEVYTTGKTIDDTTLICIADVPNLKRLDLKRTNIGDAGMDHICRHGGLEELHLVGTDVSDASIDRLLQMRKLTRLYVDGRRMSKSGLDRLTAALPKCDIVRVEEY